MVCIRIHRVAMMLCGCMMSPGLSLSAQEHTDSLRTHRLQGVEVTESRHHKALTSAAPLYVLGRGDLLQMGITDIADALHRLPGVNLRDYGGAGGMKTVGVRGFGARHTGVSYDGVLLSECQSGEIDVSRYSLDHVAVLQLVVGDNDDLFIPARQAASPATLSIETMGETPQDHSPHLTTQLRGGAFGYISPFVRYAQAVTERITLSAVGEYVYAENNYPFTLRNGIYKTREHRANSRMNSGHGEINVVWQPNELNRLWGKLYYYDNDRRLPGIVRYYTNASGETLHDRNCFGQARWLSQNRDGRWALKTNAKYNWAASSYRDDLYPGGVKDADYWQREAYASVALLCQPTDRWGFDYSADYIFNNLSSSLPTATRPYRHTVLQSLSAKYATGRFTLLARLLHSLYFNRAKDGASAKDMRRLSPSLSLSYRPLPAEQLFVRLSYKNIFRVPTFNESYYFHYGSTDLDAENTDQYNIGVTWQKNFGSRWEAQVTADAYLNHVRDKIVAVPYNMFIWTNINVGKVEGKGVDATWRVGCRLSERQHLSLTGSYSHQHIVNRTNRQSPYYGNQIAYIPRHTGSAALSWENPLVNLTLHGTGVSSRWTNNEHYEGTLIAGYWETGLSAYRHIDLGKGRLQLRGDLKNLFNRQYEIVANYPMPGISWQMTIGYEF